MDNRKSLDFKDVRIGMICEDYNGDKYEVVDKGSFAEMCRKTHTSVSDYGEELANEDAVAAANVDDPDEIIPWVYDGSGVLCFEDVKKRVRKIHWKINDDKYGGTTYSYNDDDVSIFIQQIYYHKWNRPKWSLYFETKEGRGTLRFDTAKEAKDWARRNLTEDNFEKVKNVFGSHFHFDD